MGEIIDIDRDKPHFTGELICVRCGHRAVHTWPCETLLKDLVCPSCDSKQYMIGTGQILEHGDLSGYNKQYPREMNKPGIILNFPNIGGVTSES